MRTCIGWFGGRLHALRTALALTALLLLGTAFIGGVVAQAGPDMPVERGKARAWYSPSALGRLAGPNAPDVRKFTGRLWGMFNHPHVGGLAQPKLSQDGLARLSALNQPPADVADAWSGAVTWTVGGKARSVLHAALLPNGTVSLVTHNTTFAIKPSPIGEPPAAQLDGVSQPPVLEFQTNLVTPAMTVQDNLYCTAQTFMADGRLFTASGSRILTGSDGSLYILGLGDVQANDGNGWTALAPMQAAGALPEPVRWYPTATRLADKRILMTGGFEFVRPSILKNLSAEIYNPATNSWTVTAPKGTLPESLFSYLYTHVYQLPVATPRGEVLAFGDAGTPGYMRPDGSWVLSSHTRPGSLGSGIQHPNVGTSSMLPLRVKNGEWGYTNGSILLAGGQDGGNGTAVDVYDAVLDSWSLRRDLGRFRAHPASVVLPDARILLLGGEDHKGSAGLGRAQYVDPRHNFAVTWGTDEYPEVRGYHNVAVLLPDGRVLFGSGNQDYVRGELPSFRYYSPSYMFQPRPIIEAAPATLNLGGYGWVTWEGTTPPAEVVLVGLGAMTHSFDMNQRYVQLPIHSSGVNGEHHYTIFGTPADARVAPPGPYMLFILDANHVPSVAKMVQVQ